MEGPIPLAIDEENRSILVPSRFPKGDFIYELLHGKAEGVYDFKKGTLSYSFATDQFRVVDTEGVLVYMSDDGMGVEHWLLDNRWTRGGVVEGSLSLRKR